MKIAIAHSGIRIPPRFYYTKQFLLVTVENGTVTDRQQFPAEGLTSHTRVKKLIEKGVDTLICNDIDRTSAQQLSSNGIRIYSWVTGEAEDALRYFIQGRLEVLLPGDHIYVKRKTRFYIHHGIYIGEGKVIHFTGSIREKVDPEVRETDLTRFLKGGKLKRRNYQKRLSATETIRIAKKQLSNKNFSMIWNNCEHFSTYCATGKKK
ncbi:MAG: lecithin retinol acyltransferase family protein, partial [Deltaproteobacteria bacterium]|nr:lecithin retinol acyltransferase family protein [Deltaproteobacteria bacterium]